MSEATGHRAETLTRVKTALVGASVFLGLLIFGGTFGSTFCAALIGAMMCWELANIFYKLEDRREKMISLVGISWLTIFVNMLLPRTMLECLIISFLALFSYFLATAERHPQNLKQHFDEFVFTVFSLVYVVTFIAFLPLIRQGVYGIQWTLLFLGMIWAGDSGAYFVGIRYGKRKLYPLISPKKTIEGAIGGLIASLVVSVAFKLFGFKGISWLGVIITPLVVGIFSQIGDLCESMLKRAYGIKDTGHILPGHGGFLDRFDSILFTLPIMYLCVKVFG